jgi:hypothetical protein
MTIEAALTRKLGITFIDARAIATESKIRLNMTGYPSPVGKELLISKAVKIFEKKSESARKAMQANRDAFDQSKIEAGYSASSLRITTTSSSTLDTSYAAEFYECSNVSSESRRFPRKFRNFITHR